MANKTPLYEMHLQAGAKIVNFAGWDMPLHYGSQIEEHHAVRKRVGMFDVSHMTIVDVQGADAKVFLRYLLANDIHKLAQPGRALYSCMLNTQGGVIDDLIIYFVAENSYRLVVNSATREKDLAWMQQQAANYAVKLVPQTQQAIIAVQGPEAQAVLTQIFAAQPGEQLTGLKPFHFIAKDQYFIARTGYTGEDGFEIMLSAQDAVTFWQALLSNGVRPCGLGARDTLRLEAGLNLYGNDMDETTSPLESNLAWTVSWDDPERHFIGRSALAEQQQRGIQTKLTGLALKDKGVLRSHQKVLVPGFGEGETTSGTFAPTIGKAIALARLPVAATGQCQVEIRGKYVTAEIVTPPFVRKGKLLITVD